MKYYLCAVLCIIVINLSAQLPKQDSRKQGPAPGEITNQVNNLISLCEQYRYTNPDSLYMTALEIEHLGTKNKNGVWKSWGELFRATHLTITGQSDSTYLLAQNNIALLEKRSKDQALLAQWYSLAGFALMKLNRQREALDMFYSYLGTAEHSNDKMAQFKASNNIGWAFMELNQHTKAIEHFKQALKILHENNLPDRYGAIYNNLASCYGEIEKPDSAYQYAQQGIAIATTNNDYTAIANGLNIRGTSLARQKRYKEALASFMEAKPIREKIGDPFFIVSDLAEIASLQAKTGDTSEGIRNCEKALDIIEKNNLKVKLPMVLSALAENYEASGNFRQAAATYKRLNELKDELYEDANPTALAQVQTQFETEKKEKLIQQQQFAITRRNYWIAGIIIAGVLGGLLTWSIYRRYRLKQEARMQEKIIQQQRIVTQAVLEAEEKERQRIAKDLHDGIGQMMSAAKMNLSAIENELQFSHEKQKLKFDKIISLVDESCREVRTVSHNMMPNVLLKSGLGTAIRAFINHVDNNVLKINLYYEGLNERMNINVETILYRVIQECVNNVFKHSAATNLNISLMKDKEGLSATIEDNGVGFDTAKINRYDGMGLKNIRTRIEYLKGTVEIDSRPGNGTLVAIHVPLQTV